MKDFLEHCHRHGWTPCFYAVPGEDVPAYAAAGLKGLKIGDEGMVNMLPRLIFQGFLTAHLSFGPQHAHLTDAQLSRWRKRYAAIGQQYLDA